MTWCLERLRDRSIVLDPYMGSGSTDVAVVRSGVGRFVGIESDEEIFEVAVERIEKEVIACR